MNTQSNKPVDTIRDGSLKATIWMNQRESGKAYSVQITRSYRDDQGNWHETDSFSGTELLRVARLVGIAYDEILIHRANDKASQQETA